MKNVTESWAAHLAGFLAAQQELHSTQCQLSAAVRALSVAETAASVITKQVAGEIGISCVVYPGSDDRAKIQGKLNASIREVPARLQSVSQRDRVRGLQKLLNELESREDHLQLATDAVASLEDARGVAEAHLAEVQTQQPKPTAAAFDAVTLQWEKAKEERDRISQGLEAARQELAASQGDGAAKSRADQLEAQRALAGEGKGPTAAAVTKAQAEMDLGLEEVRRLESRIRGLEDLLPPAVSLVTELDSLRCHVGEAIFTIQLAKSEEGFLTKLAEVDSIMQEMNGVRMQLNSVMGADREYDMARAKFHLPTLYATKAELAAGSSSGALSIFQ